MPSNMPKYDQNTPAGGGPKPPVPPMGTPTKSTLTGPGGEARFPGEGGSKLPRHYNPATAYKQPSGGTNFVPKDKRIPLPELYSPEDVELEGLRQGNQKSIDWNKRNPNSGDANFEENPDDPMRRGPLSEKELKYMANQQFSDVRHGRTKGGGDGEAAGTLDTLHAETPEEAMQEAHRQAQIKRGGKYQPPATIAKPHEKSSMWKKFWASMKGGAGR